MLKRTCPTSTRRGLTLVELLLSLTITIVIGAAITSIFGAVVAGVDVRRDMRSHVVRSYAGQSRLLAYIVPSRAILHAEDSMIALWFEDSRTSDTIHATEVRWLTFSRDYATITAHYVRFPDNWTSVEKWLADREYAHDSDWRTALQTWRDAGQIESITLIDGISDMRVSTDEARPLDSRHIMMRLTLSGGGTSMPMAFAATLREHSPPVK